MTARMVRECSAASSRISLRAGLGRKELQTNSHCDCCLAPLAYMSVVVMCHNHGYYFSALWPDTGHVAVDENDILDILRAIDKHASSSTTTDTASFNQQAIGVLTSLPRSEWAQARSQLVATSLQNATALHIIDSALFVLVLDDYIPTTLHAAASNMLHGTSQLSDEYDDGQYRQVGTCLNRWYDKLQLIVCQDGTSGINFEHSTIDGHTALRFVSDMYAETVISFAESIVDLIHGRGRIQHIVEATVERAVLDPQHRLDVMPKKIVLEVSDSVSDCIYFAETSLCDNVVSTDTYVLEFAGYGMSLIKQNRLSPDSVVQMSIMLAYYRLYGKLVCTYEPVLTKVSSPICSVLEHGVVRFLSSQQSHHIVFLPRPHRSHAERHTPGQDTVRSLVL
jgi:carnitine O-acetyltransferase